MSEQLNGKRLREADRSGQKPVRQRLPADDGSSLADQFALYRKQGWSDAEIEMGIAGQ